MVQITFLNENKPIPQFSDDAAAKIAFIGVHTWTGEVRCLDESGHVANTVADKEGKKDFPGDSILCQRLAEDLGKRTGKKYINDPEAGHHFSIDHPDRYSVWVRQ